MIAAAIAGLILLGIYKLMNEPDGDLVDWMATFIFVLAPGFLIFLIALGLGAAGFNTGWALLAYVLYFVIPYYWLKKYLEFSNQSAFRFSIIVPFVAIGVEVLFYSLISAR